MRELKKCKCGHFKHLHGTRAIMRGPKGGRFVVGVEKYRGQCSVKGCGCDKARDQKSS